MSNETTQKRAYAIWENEGRPEGRQVHNWEQAARELSAPHDPPQPDSPTSGPTLESPRVTGSPSRKSQPSR
jgi:hypothetical protein